MSAAPTSLYEDFADLLDYPTAALPGAAQRASERALRDWPAAAPGTLAFARRVSGRDVRDLEESYAAVFDFSPERTLDLGYQLFGETYKRGVFLVKMKEAVRDHGLDPAAELPDHLPVVLRLLAALSPEEEPRALAEEVILPAVEKVLGAFQDDGAGYRDLLSGLKSGLMADFGIDHVEPPRQATGASSTGRRLPVFPGFHVPSERTVS